MFRRSRRTGIGNLRAMRKPLAVLALAALVSAHAAVADDPFSSSGPGGVGGDPDAKDESTPDYLKALELQRKGTWKEAQQAFRAVEKKYPNSVHAQDCELRGGDNCYLGCEKLWESGPPARRIDVAVMGDGFQMDEKQQKQEEDWARLCVDVLWSEKAYDEYRNYFNFYYVRLCSKDQGVDEVLSDEQLKKRQEDAEKKHKKFKAPKEFNTALDCKAAGPQRQVMADHDLVYTWLAYANRDVPGCGDDGLVIAFAKFGELGMAELGNGLANCGKPTNSVTVHEFGHAFVGLLDEYQGNPSPPPPIRGINATTDLKDIPWQHFLDRKIKVVGTFEGGATFNKGVWRPAAVCAMNAAGAGMGYCPVCREATVLRIYATVDPIDKMNHDPQTELKAVEGDATEIVVTPMQPKSHDLKCEWYVDRIMDSDPGPQKAAAGGQTTDGSRTIRNGSRGSDVRGEGRDGTAYDAPPFGDLSDLGRVDKSGDRKKGEGTKFVFPAGKLPRGRWQVTVRVWDTTEWKDVPYPLVLKDPKHLLEERETWFVTVTKK